MNKFLMLGTAALFGIVGPALATDMSKSHTIQFYTGSGNTAFCDGMKFHTTGKGLARGKHLNEDCHGTNGTVSGKVDKTQYTLNEVSDPSLVYEIAKPIRDGGAWDVMSCSGGSSCFEINSGIYMLGFSGARTNAGPTTAKVGKLIAARKAARDGRKP